MFEGDETVAQHMEATTCSPITEYDVAPLMITGLSNRAEQGVPLT